MVAHAYNHLCFLHHRRVVQFKAIHLCLGHSVQIEHQEVNAVLHSEQVGSHRDECAILHPDTLDLQGGVRLLLEQLLVVEPSDFEQTILHRDF